jgi:hypothetical protein
MFGEGEMQAVIQTIKNVNTSGRYLGIPGSARAIPTARREMTISIIPNFRINLLLQLDAG